MIPNDLARRVGEWLRGGGPHSEIVISSRVRLARNLALHRFPARMDEAEAALVEAHCREAILATGEVEPPMYLPLHEMPELDRRFLVERHLISREHETGTLPRAIAIGRGEVLSVMVNEEDHLRLQVLQSGFRLAEAAALADAFDSGLEEKLGYAFDARFGYLTACPTNVGTGMRVSVMLHLPALVITRHIEKVFQAVSKISLAVRGLYGEGTEASGHFYQISNQASLGKSESQLVRDLEAVIPQIVRYERSARTTLLAKDRHRLEDRIWRAYGMLRHARILTSEEILTLLSAIRMGLHLGVLPEISLSDVNELTVFTQPAHLQKIEGRELSANERDLARAKFVREKLGENGNA